MNIEEDCTVTVNLSAAELLTLCMMAHEKDITLNKLVNDILWNAVNDKREDI